MPLCYDSTWKNTMTWKVIETLNGWAVQSVMNDVPLGAPRYFDTPAQADAHIEHERRIFAEVQRQIVQRFTEQVS